MNQTQTAATETRTETDQELRAFLRRAVLFTLPLLIVGGPPLAVLWISGEALRDVKPVLDASIKSGTGLIGFAWNEQNYPYMKYAGIIGQPRREVLALGSSRVLQFRQEMFTGSFWNAGYTIQTAADFREFLKLIPSDRQPDVLLIALDQWMFNSNWIATAGSGSTGSWTRNPATDYRNGLQLIPDMLTDVVRGRIRLAPLLQNRPDRPFGLNAWQNFKGFRPDGSFDYGKQIEQRLQNDPATPDFEFAASIRRVASGRERFQFGDQPDAVAIEEIRLFLAECTARGIHVVAFLPPFADSVAAAMQNSGRHNYLTQLPVSLQAVFAGTPHELHNFPTMNSCRSDDTAAVDGFHAGETATLSMLLLILETQSRLREYCNQSDLQQHLETAKHALEVYP